MDIIIQKLISFFDSLIEHYYNSNIEVLNREDEITRHFKSVNLSNGYHINKLPVIFNINGIIFFSYAISYDGENKDHGVTVMQLTNMNLNSGYKFNVMDDGQYVANLFFYNKAINLINTKDYTDENIRRFLINLRPVVTHIIREVYPNIDEKYSNVAGGVVAVATARRYGIPVTPSLLSDAYHCTIALAEGIIDMYDVNNRSFTNTPWMI